MAWAEEYEKLVIRMNTPRVVIDNVVCSTATIVKVDSARKHGVLLEAVQILTDLDLSIRKAYISSDGRWFMDVFHVTDLHGHKLTDSSLLSYIEQALGEGSEERSHDDCPEVEVEEQVLELTGTDRPGLLSEVFSVLAEFECSVVDAKVWTHKGRIASVISLNDGNVSSLQDPFKIQMIESRLWNILKGDGSDTVGARAAMCSAEVHPDRRLHQLMLADRDYEWAHSVAAVSSTTSPTTVTVQNWAERGYSVVAVHCRDRPKLLFDVVCTLTDMEYVVFHGTIDTNGDRAYQEFYIKHSNGTPISSEAERERVVQCLQAAIARRASQGLKLELSTVDRCGLLSELTRTFRENGLLVRQANVSTKDDMTSNVFYVTDAFGAPADQKLIESVQQRLGVEGLRVCEESPPWFSKKSLASGGRGIDGSAGLFNLGSFVKRNILYNLGLIRSCS